MRAGDYQAALRALPVQELHGLAGDRGIVVVAPHPDDESLGCGGMIAAARAQGRDVRVVIVSDGAASHPRSRSHPPDRLRALRRREVLGAGSILGLDAGALTFLELPDTAVPADGPLAEAAARAIAAVARDCDAGALAVTSDLDPHCDHAAAAQIARRAARLLPGCSLYAYPVWVWGLPAEAWLEATPPRGLRLDVARFRSLKQRAIAAHASQAGGVIGDDPSAFVLQPEMIERCSGRYETFVELSS